MNVLHIVSAKVWGGGETAALSMCKSLQKNGHNVYIVVSGNIHLLQEKFGQVGTVLAVPLSWGRLISCLWELRRVIVDNKIRVIHTHTGRVIPFVIMANWGLNAKVIAYRHNAIHNKKDFIHQLIYKKIDAMVCVSQFVKKSQEEDMPDWLKKKLYVVHNGIEVSKREIKTHTETRSFVVGYAGRIEENKGLLHLVRALVKLGNMDIVLKIAGRDDTRYAKQIKVYLQEQEYNKNVQWLGYITETSTFYEQIDLLVCPSLVPEAFGLSVCEAMYYGKPVITSDNGAQTELVANGVDGFLTQPGDENEIAVRIKELYNDRIKCQTMGQIAQRKVENKYTMTNWLKDMSMVYEIVLTDYKRE